MEEELCRFWFKKNCNSDSLTTFCKFSGIGTEIVTKWIRNGIIKGIIFLFTIPHFADRQKGIGIHNCWVWGIDTAIREDRRPIFAIPFRGCASPRLHLPRPNFKVYNGIGCAIDKNINMARSYEIVDPITNSDVVIKMRLTDALMRHN